MQSRVKLGICGAVLALVGVLAPVALVKPVMAEEPAKVKCDDGSEKDDIKDCPPPKCPDNSERPGYEYNTPAECYTKDDNSFMPTLLGIINFVLGVLGFVTVAVIILGGVMYATSAGDATKVQKAKSTILYGIVGLIIALLAFAIVNFILGGIFG